MSAVRGYAEVIADLRERDHGYNGNRLDLEAAVLLAAVAAALPTCPTCGGTGTVPCSCPPGTCPYGTKKPCPDCVDGKVSLAWLAAQTRELTDALDKLLADCRDAGLDVSCYYADLLRSVRPPSPKEGT